MAKGIFLSKVRPPIYAIVHAVMLSKKHQRSSTVQEEGLTNEDRHHLHKQAHEKSIAESLQAYINRARLTECEVGTSQLSKIRSALSLRSS